ENLRYCSHRDNSKYYINNLSDKNLPPGVHFNKRSGSYISRVFIEGTRYLLGSFKNPDDAAIAYNKVLEYWTQFEEIPQELVVNRKPHTEDHIKNTILSCSYKKEFREKYSAEYSAMMKRFRNLHIVYKNHLI